MTTVEDQFVALWSALTARLHGPTCFAFGPDFLTLREHASRGHVLHAWESSPGSAPILLPLDPTEESDGEDDPASIVAMWPELLLHLPKDGRLRAVATIAVRDLTGRTIEDRHQVREIDPDTLAMGPAVTVLAFGDKPN